MPDPVIAPDPVYNAPQPVTVGGRAYRVREITFLRLRDYLGEFARIADEARIKSKDDIDQNVLLNVFADVYVRILSESTDVPREHINELTASDIFELTNHWLTIHDRALDHFFQVAGRIAKLKTGLDGSSGNGSAKPSTSPDLWGQGSA